MEQPIIITQYFPVAYCEGSLLAQLKNHVKHSSEDIEDACKDFLTSHIEDWPFLEEEEEGSTYYQDTENFEIVSIDEMGAIISTGADWQQPLRIYITCDLTGQKRVWKAELIEQIDDGLSYQDLIKIIDDGK